MTFDNFAKSSKTVRATQLGLDVVTGCFAIYTCRFYQINYRLGLFDLTVKEYG